MDHYLVQGEVEMPNADAQFWSLGNPMYHKFRYNLIMYVQYSISILNKIMYLSNHHSYIIHTRRYRKEVSRSPAKQPIK